MSNIIVLAFSPRNVVGCLLKEGLQRGVTGTPRTPLATPLKGSEKSTHHKKGETRESNHSIPTDAPAPPPPYHPLTIDRSRTSTSGRVQTGSKS